MSLREIVNVSITRETRSVSRPGFGVAMILGTHHRFTSRIKFYTALDGVAADFSTVDKEYIAASAIFAQNPCVERIAIGRRAADVANLIVTTVTNSRAYTVTINGTAFTFTSDASATKDEIAGGLVALINAGAEPVAASSGTVGTGRFTISADVAGTAFSVINGVAGSFDAKLLIEGATANGDVATDLAAIKQINDTWYGLILTSREVADIVDMSGETGAANWVEANKKIFLTASNVTAIINTADPETTSIAGMIHAKGYDRTQVMFHESAATLYPEAAVIGKILPQTPGSYTEMFKTLAGVTVSELTSDQATTALAKNVLIYQEIGSVPITREGKVGSGEFLDTIIFVDWLETEIQYNVFTLLASQIKVPFIEAGISAVGGQISAALQKGLDNGGLSPFAYNTNKEQIGGYIVKMPALSSISTADKAARHLGDIKFTGWLAGAIHSVKIAGVVTL